MKRRIVLMAKSKKGEDGYCVAGIDFDSGAWVRLNVPGCYSVPRKLFRYEDGTEPSILDLINVDVIAKDQRKRLQPENYFCDLRAFNKNNEDVSETITQRLEIDKAHDYVFYDTDISVDEQKIYENEDRYYSLMIIEPDNLTFYRDDRGKVQAYFEYNDQKYKGIRVTDLDFIEQWDDTGQNKHYRPEGRCLLVVSLGEPFSKDYYEPPRCWKLIASVIRIKEPNKSMIENDDTVEEYDEYDNSQLSLTDFDNSNKDLFEELKDIRLTLARKEGVPPFCVFQDKSLRSMCELLPTKDEEFLAVYGVGKSRLEKYGSSFMEAIRRHVLAIYGEDSDVKESEENVEGVEEYDSDDSTDIIEILESIFEGYHPITGEKLDESELKNNDLFRLVIAALYNKYIKLVKEKPERVGSPWDDEEDKTLVEEFSKGLSVSEIAEKHGRTKGAIRSRLIRKGLLEK